jgi:hypothetical protein
MNSEQGRTVGILGIVATVAAASATGVGLPVMAVVGGVAVVGIIAYAVKEIWTHD